MFFIFFCFSSLSLHLTSCGLSLDHVESRVIARAHRSAVHEKYLRSSPRFSLFADFERVSLSRA
jgi:hypothetical protein